MKKTINIDIAGQLFRIDEDAFGQLDSYLKNITHRFGKEPGGEETVNDIESRIAEIFGGGQEPPVVITREMISAMIGIMGEPDDFAADNYDAGSRPYSSDRKGHAAKVKSKASRILTAFGKGAGSFFYLLFRVFMIITGTVLSLFGFLMLFSFITMVFFNGTPLVRDLFEPDIINLNALVSIALNTPNVLPVMVLSAIVVVIPLAVLTYLGIVMVFNLRGQSKIAGIALFAVWLLSVAVLGVTLSARLSVYSEHKSVTQMIAIHGDPDTIYLAPARRLSDLKDYEYASVDHSSFYRTAGTMSGSALVRISAPDSTDSYISIEKRANGKSDYEAMENLRGVDYSCRFSGDTLFVDEYYSIRNSNEWNGSMAVIHIAAREGTIIKCINGLKAEKLGLRVYGEAAPVFRITDYSYENTQR